MNSDETELRRLKWIAVVVPLIFLFAVEIVRARPSPGLFDAWPGHLLIAGVVLLGVLFFAETIFRVVGRMQLRATHQNLELLALHEAGIAITAELELDRVLQQVVDQARELGASRYGALSLLNDDGAIQSFLTSGITKEEREAIGPIPVGHGLLGAVSDEGKALRIPDLTQDPRSCGFPADHPPMHSLLAVPILSRGRILGSLYLTEKEHGGVFDNDDQLRLERFATHAAIAIENARLHQQVWTLAVTQERERIAREMHDSIAQVLGYVNTKAQAAQELLRAGQPEKAEAQISQLSEVARDAYSDVRENILGLRTSLDTERGFVDTLGDYLESWEDQSQIHATLTTIPAEPFESELTSLAELQLLRIIQEALANVRKHSGATHVSIALCQRSGELEVTIIDNGEGFDVSVDGPRRFPRFGLAIMRERAQTVNGRFDLDSSMGEGTKVRVTVPHDGDARLPFGDTHAGAHR